MHRLQHAEPPRRRCGHRASVSLGLATKWGPCSADGGLLHRALFVPFFQQGDHVLGKQKQVKGTRGAGVRFCEKSRKIRLEKHQEHSNLSVKNSGHF